VASSIGYTSTWKPGARPSRLSSRVATAARLPPELSLAIPTGPTPPASCTLAAAISCMTVRASSTAAGNGCSGASRTFGATISEKDPGYPYLAVAFQALGLIRLAPLFYGALACLGL
jgi:hypothetical protein